VRVPLKGTAAWAVKLLAVVRINPEDTVVHTISAVGCLVILYLSRGGFLLLGLGSSFGLNYLNYGGMKDPSNIGTKDLK
jgi:hypothetical protein